MAAKRDILEPLPPGHSPSEVYARFLPEALSIPKDDLTTVNLNVRDVAVRCVAVGELVRAEREYFRAVPHLDHRAFDTLHDLGIALNEAHAIYLVRLRPTNPLKSLAARALKYRTTLIVWIRALMNLGLIDPRVLNRIPMTKAYNDLHSGLDALTTVFRQADWKTIKKRSGMTDEFLLEVSGLVIQMMEALGHRRFEPFHREEAADRRQRLLTLCVRAYSEVQRGVYLWRWHHGDAEVKAPSLFKRGPRRKKSDANSADPMGGSERMVGNAAGESQQAASSALGISNAVPVVSA